jgi:hypothetical protein
MCDGVTTTMNERNLAKEIVTGCGARRADGDGGGASLARRRGRGGQLDRPPHQFRLSEACYAVPSRPLFSLAAHHCTGGQISSTISACDGRMILCAHN